MVTNPTTFHDAHSDASSDLKKTLAHRHSLAATAFPPHQLSDVNFSQTIFFHPPTRDGPIYTTSSGVWRLPRQPPPIPFLHHPVPTKLLHFALAFSLSLSLSRFRLKIGLNDPSYLIDIAIRSRANLLNELVLILRVSPRDVRAQHARSVSHIAGELVVRNVQSRYRLESRSNTQIQYEGRRGIVCSPSPMWLGQAYSRR